MPWKKWVPDAQDSTLFAIIGFIGVVFSAKDALGLFMSEDHAKYILLAVFLLLVLRFVLRQVRLAQIPPLPKKPVIFNPFKISFEGAAVRLWKRSAETDALAETLEGCCDKHLIVTGPSGAGKSTLIIDFVKPHFEKRECPVHVFSRYGAFVVEFVECVDGPSHVLLRQRELIRRYRALVDARPCSVKEVFDPLFADAQAEVVWADMEAFFKEVFYRGRTNVFVFDQVERIFSVLKADAQSSDTLVNGLDAWFFIRIVRHLRQSASARTLFITRSDFLYQSFDFLQNLALYGQEGRGEATLTHYLCPGINTITSPEAVSEIRLDFKKIPSVSSYAQHFSRITGLDSRSVSNTFLTQLFGFIIEHFYASDARVVALLQKEGDVAQSLRFYFEYLLSDYARNNASFDALDILKISIFTIAVENRASGQAAPLERIAALAHVPLASVRDTIDYLRPTGLLIEEEKDGSPAFRLVHDIVADYAIENEQFEVDVLLKDGIRSLSETQVSSRDLTPIDAFAHPLFDWVAQPNVGLVAIWALYVFGAVKLLAPSTCQALDAAFRLVPAAVSCDESGRFYVPIYFMHVVWLTFIYFLDRGYFRHVYRTRMLRGVSAMMPVIGSILAIGVSQSPDLFLFPVAAVGTIMGLLLVIGSFNGSFLGRDAKINRRWGVRTIFNMIFASISMVITAIVLQRSPTAVDFWKGAKLSIGSLSYAVTLDEVQLTWMYVINGLMIYFWWHIRPEQQSRISLAARLAVYDRTRHENLIQHGA